MPVLTITAKNFETEVTSSEKPVLLDFYADWCNPCRMFSPTIEAIASERPDIRVGKINIDNDPELAEKFGIMSIPTIAVIKNGELKARSVGVKSKEAVLSLIDG